VIAAIVMGGNDMLLAEKLGDKMVAFSMGMTEAKYTHLKQAYIDTYNTVTPMEGRVNIQREQDGTISARNAFVGSSKCRRWGKY
jgi:hypothetical protein